MLSPEDIASIARNLASDVSERIDDSVRDRTGQELTDAQFDVLSTKMTEYIEDALSVATKEV